MNLEFRFECLNVKMRAVKEVPESSYVQCTEKIMNFTQAVSFV